jgi:hypothetical protein
MSFTFGAFAPPRATTTSFGGIRVTPVGSFSLFGPAKTAKPKR